MTDAFNRDGFVIVDKVFTKRELNEFRWAFAYLDFATDGERYDCAAMMPEFLRLVAKPEIVQTVNALLHRPIDRPLYCFTNRCRIDRPFDDRRTYGWHQEVFYTIPQSRFIQTWAPLISDTTVENGTIEVLVGSHVEGIAPQTWTSRPHGAHQIIIAPEIVAKYEARPVPMKLGQVMFFDSRLIHRSGLNTSARTRYSMVGMYHDTDVVRVPVPRFHYRGQTPRQWYETF